MHWNRAAATLAATLLLGASPGAISVKQNIERLEAEKVPPGSKVFFPSADLNQYVVELMRQEVGDGIRNPRLILGTNRAEGRAIVNFVKLQTDKGKPPGLLVGLLLRGEHDLEVRVKSTSGGGKAQVDVEEVSLDGLVMRGRTLDLLIEYYLAPRVPDVKIGKPFDLKHGVDRVDAAPEGVTVHTAAKPGPAR
jgi:hypothetical protein